jgi:hypothetical protein
VSLAEDLVLKELPGKCPEFDTHVSRARRILGTFRGGDSQSFERSAAMGRRMQPTKITIADRDGPIGKALRGV